MPIDPNTGEWVQGPPTQNAGPFAGVLGIMNAMRGSDLAQRSDTSQQLALHMQQLKAQQEEHEYGRQLGYENAVDQLGPHASLEDVATTMGRYANPNQPGALSAVMYAPGRYLQGLGAYDRGQGAQATGQANLEKADILNRTLKDKEAADLFNKQGNEYDAIAQRARSAAGYDDARKAAANRLSGPMAQLKDAEAAYYRAKSNATNANQTGPGFLKDAERRLDSLNKSIFAAESQLSNEMQFHTPQGIVAMRDTLDEMKTRAKNLSDQILETKTKSSQASPVGQHGTASDTATSAVSDQQKLSTLFNTYSSGKQ